MCDWVVSQWMCHCYQTNCQSFAVKQPSRCLSDNPSLTRNCAHTLSCVPPLSFRSKWDWKSRQNAKLQACQNFPFKLLKPSELTFSALLLQSTEKHISPKRQHKRKLTRQNRCFYLRMNSRGHCKGVFDGGISSCCPRTQRVCSERQNRPGTRVRRPELAPTSRRHRLLPGSGRAQHFQNCYHYL